MMEKKSGQVYIAALSEEAMLIVVINRLNSVIWHLKN